MEPFDSAGAVYGGRSQHQIRLLICAAATTVALFLYWEGRVADRLLWDEGWIWAGVQRVIGGEVPIRDFGSYDPGRYYWSAAIMTILGDNGVLANRLATSLFQFIGLFLGLLLVTPSRARAGITRVLVSSIVVCLWMYPQYKAFDSTIAIALIFSLAYLCARPTNGRIFFSGVAVGIAAFFSKNHGLYGSIGALSILCYLGRTGMVRSFLSSFVSWTAGVFVGYLPMILMFLFVPGLLRRLLTGFEMLYELKTTNLTLAIPWPWLADFHRSLYEGTRDFAVGLFFIAVIAYGLVGLLMLGYSIVKRQQLSPVIVASAALALPYMHYALSRADVYHLALGIFPLLICGLSWSNRTPNGLKTCGLLGLFIATMLSIFPHHPGWMAKRAGNWPVVHVANDVMIVDPGTAFQLSLVGDLVDKYSPNGRAFLVAPFWPGIYPAFGRKSPMLDDYALFSRTETFQKAEIERIKNANPAFVLIFDYALDKQQDRRFTETHALIDQFIRNNYQPVMEDNLKNRLLRLYLASTTHDSVSSAARQ